MQQSRTYYTINGASERSMLLEMRRKGPRVHGKPALAATRMKASYRANLRRKRDDMCRVTNIDMNVRFIMRLPKLHHERRLRGSIRKRWHGFQRMLERHENKHISIWKNCVHKVHVELPKLKARDCQQLKRLMRQRYQAIMTSCRRQHDAFDRRERHAEPKVPFIRAALASAATYVKPRKKTGRHHAQRNFTRGYGR
jgi:predicted secreted Zn-dependent protease